MKVWLYRVDVMVDYRIVELIQRMKEHYVGDVLSETRVLSALEKLHYFL